MNFQIFFFLYDFMNGQIFKGISPHLHCDSSGFLLLLFSPLLSSTENSFLFGKEMGKKGHRMKSQIRFLNFDCNCICPSYPT